MLSLTFSRFMGVLILLVTLFLGISVEATTRSVRQDGAGGAFTTIQAALDASLANDVIEIKDGQTYAENLVITLQGLVLRTAAPDPIATISNGLVIHAQGVVVERLNVTSGGAGITFDQDNSGLLLTNSTVNNCGAQGVSILASTVTLTAQNSSISNNGGKGIDIEDPGSGFERIGTEIRLTDCHVDNNVARNMGWAARNNKGICDATGCTFNAVNEVTERSFEIDGVNEVMLNLVSCTINGPSGSGFGVNTNGQNVTSRLIDCEINGWSENQVRSTRNAGTINEIEFKDCVIKGFSTRGVQVRGHIGPLTISNCIFEGGLGDACLRIQEVEVSSDIVFENITARKGALGWRFRDNYGSTMTAKNILVEQCENGILIYRNTDPDVPTSITFEDSVIQNNTTGIRFNENVDLVTLNLNDCLIRDSEKEINNIETMRGQRVGGLFILPVHEYDTRVSLDHLLRLKLDKYPFVIIGKVPGFDFDWVAIEESDAASMTAQYLLNLGHKNFCLLGYDANNRTVVERFDSISVTLLQHQVEIEKDLIVEEVGTWVNGGIFSWQREVDRIMSREKRPTAFITANDTIALITIRELETLGYSVPGDISVVGFDNSDFSALTHPTITTNAKNMEDLARLATEILVGKVEDPNRKSTQCEIPQRLIERDSCGPCADGSR